MTKTYYCLILSTVTALLSACASPRHIVANSRFDPDTARAMLSNGNNTIKGSALIRQAGGGIVTCAGQEVALIPATSYATERIVALYGSPSGGYRNVFGSGQIIFDDEPPDFKMYIRTTTCDAQGFFKFTEVADGEFYASTSITWRISDYLQAGGVLAQKVALSGAEIKEVVLAPR